jgi:hypothetical protein
MRDILFEAGLWRYQNFDMFYSRLDSVPVHEIEVRFREPKHIWTLPTFLALPIEEAKKITSVYSSALNLDYKCARLEAPMKRYNLPGS